MTDPDYIQLTLELAAEGTGLVSPNPLVGSVIVKDGEIIGRGFHRYSELKHAEAWALEEAGERARGATAYVNLEPCSHNGEGKRTPPCVQALIDAGVSRVVAAMVDPNPKVNGRGFEMLREAGIEVSVGLMEKEARRLNEKYARFVTTRLPFVHLKIACSLDGRIATRAGDSKWITGEEARAASQSLRHESDAMMVGVGTVRADDPLLSDRTGRPRHRPLVRVALDAGLRTPLTSQLIQTARELPLIIFAAEQELLDNMGFPIYADSGPTMAVRQEALESFGVEVVRVASDGGLLDLKQVLENLGSRYLASVLIEGGAEVAASVIEQRLADKVTFFVAPKIIGGREAVSAIGGQGIERLSEALELRDVEVVPRGNDIEITGYPRPPAHA
ncbi:MAG TPA: bifunctional diaminohydroxyphosphoribosylaminopyrimidine deaminase/5-amino-6-(5-phosphoribosylamino)uracil reductase RibD [Blastocatellia bacterium]|nr:bifunctional diaminohydroxyphosphoribosylaminopyrimidine deaminase/5-amino-6-(5-phosphoribosylamino)uracil reductase RibD [Blastocatellia bacterium]